MNTTEISLEEIKNQIETLKRKLSETENLKVTNEVSEREEALAQLVKKALIIIEATYLQSKEGFITARANAYFEIVSSFKSLGFNYDTHPELRQKVDQLELTRMPMTRSIREKESDVVKINKQVG